LRGERRRDAEAPRASAAHRAVVLERLMPGEGALEHMRRVSAATRGCYRDASLLGLRDSLTMPITPPSRPAPTA
jgi:hypothetical protein